MRIDNFAYYTQIKFKTRVFLLELTSDPWSKMLHLHPLKTRVFILSAV